ncbi:MAG TPA: alanine--tRNA ligase [Clostridiales bacterium]|jgi:alanyl-tRNA synthetase|nr:alanine--tRNA ligase [Clostridiales bacterium]
MEKLGLNELREKFLSFFESKGHLRHPSFPLLPQGDNSLLLINSGMAPLKPYFSGEAIPPRRRMTTCQKCIRTPDIERVGKTSRHGTFFEMLGNFSFGDYFKREAITWAWEFVTEELKIPKDKLYVSVYLEDDEAYDIWTKEVGVSPDHMARLGKEDNFWEIGAGPCGPCSEIYFDRGPEHGCGSPDCKVGCDCDRYVEFWNLVFTQFNNDGNGNYTELKQKNIDTGMGLERLACIMQGVNTLFDVDTVMNITNHVSQITGVTYGKSEKADVSLRVITDHIRSTTMLISDGILPSNEGRGYVLRRLLRRAARHGKLLGVTKPFLYEVCQTVINESKEAYPELEEKREYITKIIKVEEENFNKTIDAGMKILGEMVEEMRANGDTVMSGENSFKLYDTYGFPIDLTIEILEEQKMTVDLDAFNAHMKEQRERARAATAALGDFGWESLDLGLDKSIKTNFTGYEKFEDTGTVLAIVVDNEPRSAAFAGEEAIVVLDTTPFYAEKGGQVADTGVLKAEGLLFEVTDVRPSKDDKFLHTGIVKEGEIKVGQAVTASVDAERRRAIMRAHSATHLLQKALRNVLGNHVEQAGSLVSPDTVRFDFTHFSALTPEEIAAIDSEVNDMILMDLEVLVREMPIAEAKAMGAIALFGEKYDDTVRVVRMGDYSIELCGGTHLANTAKIGSFRILAEFSVASGVRRIEAVVGKRVLDYTNERVKLIFTVAEELKTTPKDLVQRAHQIMEELRETKKNYEKIHEQQLQTEAERFLHGSKDVDGLKIVTVSREGFTADDLRTVANTLKDRDDAVVGLLAATGGDKITLLAVCGKNAIARGIKAGDMIKFVTSIMGGSGGGKPDIAMGGGKDISLLKDAMAKVRSFVSEKAK